MPPGVGNTSSPGPSRLPRLLLYAGALVGVALIAWSQVASRADSGYLLDFYPLYRGAEALLETGDAYAVQAPEPATSGVAAVGNSYPIHAVLLFGVPLSWLPPAIAVAAWTLALGFAWILAVRWAGESPYWFLWVPMWQALLLQQPSAALGVAAVVALGALRHRSPWTLSLALVVLTMKPQQFLLLALVLAWWGRAWWRQIAITFTSVAAAAFLAQPDWIERWIERVEMRAELVPVVWVWAPLIPVGGFLILRGWGIPGLAIVSSALGPWPAVGGSYSAVAWPLGAGRTQAATLALLGLIAFFARVNSTMTFVLVMAVGVVVAAILAPGKLPSCTDPRNENGQGKQMAPPLPRVVGQDGVRD